MFVTPPFFDVMSGDRKHIVLRLAAWSRVRRNTPAPKDGLDRRPTSIQKSADAVASLADRRHRLDHSMAQTRVGLVLRTLGVAILLTWGPPQPDLAETMGIDEGTKRLKRRYDAMPRVGLDLIGLGFFGDPRRPALRG